VQSWPQDAIVGQAAAALSGRIRIEGWRLARRTTSSTPSCKSPSTGFRWLSIPRNVFSGDLTLSLLILPVVIVASQEAPRSIASSLRHGACALGATQGQTIRHQVLPPAIPGILTGVILAHSRAIGETAPLAMIGALTYIAYTPGSIEPPSDVVRNPQAFVDARFALFTTMPILIFNGVS
jgi:phosphate transport system permease protein